MQIAVVISVAVVVGIGVFAHPAAGVLAAIGIASMFANYFVQSNHESTQPRNKG